MIESPPSDQVNYLMQAPLDSFVPIPDIRNKLQIWSPTRPYIFFTLLALNYPKWIQNGNVLVVILQGA